MRNYWEEFKETKLDKKKIPTIVTAVIIAIILIAITIVYFTNITVREWVDKNI